MLNAQKKLNKKHGEGMFVVPGRDKHYGSLPTGILNLTATMECGYPYGKISMIYAEKGHCKTGMTYRAASMWQERHPELPLVFLDLEHEYDRAYAEALGVDTDAWSVSDTGIIDEAFDIMYTYMDEEGQCMFIYDAVTAGDTSVVDQRASVEMHLKSDMARATYFKSKLPRLRNLLNKTKSIVIFVSHEAVVMDTYGKRKPKGGNALPEKAALMLYPHRSTSTLSGGWGCSIDKSKVGDTEGRRTHNWNGGKRIGWSVANGGFDDIQATLEGGIISGVLNLQGQTVHHTESGKKLGTRNVAYEALKKDPKKVQQIKDAVHDMYNVHLRSD